MHTLIIIDMQPGFNAAFNPKLKKPITREIKLCKKHNWPIIIVEYRDAYSGTTLKWITDQIKNYKHSFTVHKKENDGSGAIIKALSKRGLSIDKARIIGVNTGACVQSTATGLKYNHKIETEIVADGCYSWSHEHHIFGLREIQWAGIKILHCPKLYKVDS